MASQWFDAAKDHFTSLPHDNQVGAAASLLPIGAGITNAAGVGEADPWETEEEQKNKGLLTRMWQHPAAAPALLLGGGAIAGHHLTGGKPIEAIQNLFSKQSNAGCSYLNPIGAGMEGSSMSVPTMDGPTSMTTPMSSGGEALAKMAKLAEISPFCAGYLKYCKDKGFTKDQTLYAIKQSALLDESVLAEWDKVFEKVADGGLTDLISGGFGTGMQTLHKGVTGVRDFLGKSQQVASDAAQGVAKAVPQIAGSLHNTASQGLAGAQKYIGQGVEGAQKHLGNFANDMSTRLNHLTQAPQNLGWQQQLGHIWSSLTPHQRWMLGAGLVGTVGGLAGAGGEGSWVNPLLMAGGPLLMGHALTGHAPWESDYWNKVMQPSTWGANRGATNMAHNIGAGISQYLPLHPDVAAAGKGIGSSVGNRLL